MSKFEMESNIGLPLNPLGIEMNRPLKGPGDSGQSNGDEGVGDMGDEVPLPDPPSTN